MGTKQRAAVVIISTAMGLVSSASQARADGRLSYSLIAQGRYVFLDVRESDQIVEGRLSTTWGTAYVQVFVVGNRLVLPTNESYDYLDFAAGSRRVHYEGLLTSTTGLPVVSFITATTQTHKLRVSGDVAGVPFRYDVKSKAATHAATLEWNDLSLEFSSTSEEPGGCSGHLHNGARQQLGTFWCHSEGSLEDALFDNPDQIIGWLLHVLVGKLFD